MKPSEEMMLRLYHKLGKLFYAVAAADNNVHKEEAEKLYQLVKQDWVPVEDTNDEFGSDAAFQIISAFDLLNDQMASSKNCLHQFEEFYQTHRYLFTDRIKTLTLRTADAIAHAVNRKNKAEFQIIHQIQRLFKT
jgi:hypothetical protein